MSNLAIAFEIMGKGMAGIFVAIIIIMLAVMVLGKVTSGKKDEQYDDSLFRKCLRVLLRRHLAPERIVRFVPALF